MDKNFEIPPMLGAQTQISQEDYEMQKLNSSQGSFPPPQFTNIHRS